MKSILILFSLVFFSCSKLEYPIVTKYKETKIKYEKKIVSLNKKYKKNNSNPIVRDFVIWTILSITGGIIILK